MTNNHKNEPRRYEGRILPNQEEDVFDQGLAFDVETLMGRRRVLKLLGFSALGAAGLASIAACGAAESAATTAAGTATTAAAGASGVCAVIPEETAGPYPGDGSNGPDVLAESGVVRSDITSSFGDYSGTADGVPLTIELAIQDLSNGCEAFAGAAVYLWHCDRDGLYSLYTIEDQNYLRGVQEADANGVVRFTSIFPACYSGRWPHIHFEVFPTIDAAADDANKIATSQVALPEDICAEVYATEGYEVSITNLAQVTLESDNVFGEDSGVSQLGTVTGTIEDGLTVTLAVPVST